MDKFSPPMLSTQEHALWQQTLSQLNQYNLYCACGHCGYEWVDSEVGIPCPRCQSPQIQIISCWQFPDD